MTTTQHHPTPEARMAALARTFPGMAKAAGVAVWDATALDRWAAGTPLVYGELVTARFLLTVWEPNQTWESGRFDLMDALQVWDDRQRAAFLAWANDPWWP